MPNAAFPPIRRLASGGDDAVLPFVDKEGVGLPSEFERAVYAARGFLWDRVGDITNSGRALQS